LQINGGYEDISSELDAELHSQLKKLGDDFRSPNSYIEEWGFAVEPVRKAIPYDDFAGAGQAPKRKK